MSDVRDYWEGVPLVMMRCDEKKKKKTTEGVSDVRRY